MLRMTNNPLEELIVSRSLLCKTEDKTGEKTNEDNFNIEIIKNYLRIFETCYC